MRFRKTGPLRVVFTVGLAFLLAACGVAVASTSINETELQLLRSAIADRPLVLIGEIHQKPESIRLARYAAELLSARHRCVSTALEVDYLQQPKLDAVAEGSGAPGDVDIHPIIDHPALRNLVGQLGQPIRLAGCGRIVAADSPVSVPDEDRDTAMAARVLAASETSNAVLGLFGNRHVARGLRWDDGGPSVLSDQLAAAGKQPFVILQVWLNRQAAGPVTGSYVSCADPIVALLLRRFRSGVNGRYPNDPARICDVLWVWSPAP